MSESVAKGFEYYGGSEMEETIRFIRMFDKFFDCLNVRSPVEHVKKKKPNLKPYTNSHDERLKVVVDTDSL